MSDPDTLLIVSTAALVALAMLVAGALTGWHGWLALKRQELLARTPADAPLPGTASARIELADLKERIRRLEAIAAGVDL